MRQGLRSGRTSRPVRVEAPSEGQTARKARLKAVVETNPGFEKEISNLELLDDDALRMATQTGMPRLDSRRMEELHRRQRLTGLSDAEGQELSRLEQQYERVILVRSHSTWLLEQRGHDVHSLTSATKSFKPTTGR